MLEAWEDAGPPARVTGRGGGQTFDKLSLLPPFFSPIGASIGFPGFLSFPLESFCLVADRPPLGLMVSGGPGG